MLEVKPLAIVAMWPPEVAEMATKPLLALLQKHSLGGCTIDMPPSNCHRHGAYLFILPIWTTHPFIPPGSLNRVPALIGWLKARILPLPGNR